MNIRRKLLAVVGACSLVALAGCSSAESPSGADASGVPEMKLTFASPVSEDSPHSEFLLTWQDKITELSDGAITFENFFNSSLCGGTEISECVRDGRADVGWTVPNYTPSLFPASSVMTIPFTTTNTQAKVEAMYEFGTTNETIVEEYENQNMKLVLVSPTLPPLVGSTKEIRDIDDLAGVSVIANNVDVANAYQALNMNPTSMQYEEFYESLERGVVDSASIALDVILDAHLYEVMDYYYPLGEPQGSGNYLHTIINLDTWNKLGEDLQREIEAMSAEMTVSMMETYFVPYFEAGCQTLSEAGGTYAQLGPEDKLQAWADDFQRQSAGAWVERIQADGVDAPDALLDAFMAVVQDKEASAPAVPEIYDICEQQFNG